MSTISKAIEYICRFDPPLAAELEPATEVEISELTRLASQPLPSVYLDFLRRMGSSAGWLLIGQANPAIEAVLGAHRRGRGSHPGYILIGVGEEDPYFDVFLELSSSPAVPPRVIACPWSANFASSLADFRSPVAGSLEEAICTPVFLDRVLMAMPCRELRLVSADPSAQPQGAANLVAALGMQTHWFSNDWSLVAESPQLSVHIWKAGSGTLTARIGAHEPPALDALRAHLSTVLPGLHNV